MLGYGWTKDNAYILRIDTPHEIKKWIHKCAMLDIKKLLLIATRVHVIKPAPPHLSEFGEPALGRARMR